MNTDDMARQLAQQRVSEALGAQRGFGGLFEALGLPTPDRSMGRFYTQQQESHLKRKLNRGYIPDNILGQATNDLRSQQNLIQLLQSSMAQPKAPPPIPPELAMLGIQQGYTAPGNAQLPAGFTSGLPASSGGGLIGSLLSATNSAIGQVRGSSLPVASLPRNSSHVGGMPGISGPSIPSGLLQSFASSFQPQNPTILKAVK